MKIRNISSRCSRSVDDAKLGLFTLLICRGRQRNVPIYNAREQPFVLLVKPFVWWRSRCRRRCGLLNRANNSSASIARCPQLSHVLLFTTCFPSTELAEISGDKGSYSNDALQRDQEKEAHKVMKILTVVVIVFALLMLPNHIVFLWFDFGNGSKW